ncbi:MAG: DUF4248 domain-containing protein [Bacteroidaceae bacterium]|nr:DUF4248 domain-containing protein [Bacteroidaceae bacterium]
MNSFFRIRSYGRMELAQMYFPDLQGTSAFRKFKGWLRVNPRLNAQILQQDNHSRTYTPDQVRLIVAELGEP